MDDEEEDMSRPISQLWGTPFRDVKYEERATQIAAGQALAAAPTSQSHNNNNNEDIDAMPCSLHRQPRIPFHGNAGLRSHFPAQFEPTEDRGERRVEEDEEEEEEEEEGRAEGDGRMAERPEEQRAGASVEAQIGRKLREIGDKFQQDHVELFMRHQRPNLPAWMRLTMALFGFLFPREALVPRLRGEHR
ncbi:BCL2 modifying factor 2 [Pungitius pungitius]|uniref:BCL2 modifying factor 2 n=1 Tax=Pungitius pungitius TaxID=134920 RepID=UPI002E14257F